jgi:hypothetical protein
MRLDWELLYEDETQLYPKLLQFGDFADPRFRYGINEKLDRTLYFYFPAERNNKSIEAVVMANVSFHEDMIEGHAALVLTLLNNQLKNLFDDLIGSLVLQTREIGSDASKSDFIILCNEWFELFDPLSSKLSKADLQGIFAEVYFLKMILLNSQVSFNDILRSWKGPFGKGHDFELGDNLFEVKSRLDTTPLIHISSEYQLDYLMGQNMQLVVYNFSVHNENGISIAQLIQEIEELLRTFSGINLRIFWAALGKIKLTKNNLNDYDHYLFSIIGISIYDCTLLDFPSIRRSKIPDAVRNVKYELSLSTLNNFELKNITDFI